MGVDKCLDSFSRHIYSRVDLPFEGKVEPDQLYQLQFHSSPCPPCACGMGGYVCSAPAPPSVQSRYLAHMRERPVSSSPPLWGTLPSDARVLYYVELMQHAAGPMIQLQCSSSDDGFPTLPSRPTRIACSTQPVFHHHSSPMQSDSLLVVDNEPFWVHAATSRPRMGVQSFEFADARLRRHTPQSKIDYVASAVWLNGELAASLPDCRRPGL
ncbi:hypothetical protein EJ06DRAFT_90598 [Trichodelitschia bisporula]|uniref:Uncharacterized protein n=1 Tax=Trichodelitschia bisporula TaxID=703511 RepID=A0A6G1HRV3_9PEZI|nr:hypothetical protein EJ06DRAFT_90598 [Trichodelitschia bisporula]